MLAGIILFIVVIGILIIQSTTITQNNRLILKQQRAIDKLQESAKKTTDRMALIVNEDAITAHKSLTKLVKEIS